MKLEERIKDAYGRLTASEKTVFLSVFIAGLIAHLFIFTNIIPNFDGTSRVYEEQQMTIVGRWFLHYATSVNMFTQMPLVIGVLANFFLAVSAMQIVRMFDIRNSFVAGMWGVLYAVFPAMADTYAYTFTASAYAIAVFLSVSAVLVAKKGKWGLAVGAVLLALAMGIYQTYAAVAIFLAVLLVIREVADPKKTTAAVFKTGIGYVLFLAVGAAVYYVTLQVFLGIKELELSSYLGMHDVGKGFPLAALPSAVAQAYVQVAKFFLGRANGLDSALFVGLNVLLGAVSVILAVRVVMVRKLHREPVKLVGFLVLMLLLPLASNFVQIMNPLSAPRLLMKFAFVFIYLVPVVLWGLLGGEEAKGKVASGAKMTILVAFLALSVYFWQYDNLLYTMLNHAHRATLSYATSMVSKIESCEGYRSGMQIVVIGGFPSDKYDTDIESFETVRSESAQSSSVIPLNKHIYYYLNDWLNVPAKEPEDALCYAITETEEFRQMPLYPSQGSVQVIGDCVVVKVREQYYPKSAYEKQYDNRR